MDPKDAKSIPPIVYKDDGPISIRIFVIFSSLLTIGLWATYEFTKQFFGDLGNIALLFMVIFYTL